MYIPRDFAETAPSVLAALIRDYGFATLVTVVDGAPVASHVPLIFEPRHGPRGTLYGHLARANPQWRAFDRVREALAIFHGPHAYVSPNWYREPARAVPTWNYAVAHVHGAPRLIDDVREAKAVLARLVAAYEGHRTEPWSLDRLDARYLATQLRGIVAFEMPVERIEGKFKLNQNKSPEDRASVIAGLRGEPYAESRALADLMARREDTE